jgi:excisionase family DNA binding protein
LGGGSRRQPSRGRLRARADRRCQGLRLIEGMTVQQRTRTARAGSGVRAGSAPGTAGSRSDGRGGGQPLPSVEPVRGERLMTVAEVAEMLSIPLETVYAWRSRGLGPLGYRVGRYVRYRRSAVESWLESQLDQHETRGRGHHRAASWTERRPPGAGGFGRAGGGLLSWWCSSTGLWWSPALAWEGL